MFKWLTVLYVDPQNLMTNRRKPPLGAGVGFEGKTMKTTRYKYLHDLHCKPVNASKITTRIHNIRHPQ